MDYKSFTEPLDSIGPKNSIANWLYHKGYLGKNGWWWVKNPHRLIPETYDHIDREIRKFYQRGTRGWADEDTCSLDHYILSWLPDALEKVAQDAHGAPLDFGYSKKEIEHFYAENPTEHSIDFDLSYAMWQDEINDIATILREIHADNIFLSDEDMKLFKKTWKRLGKIFHSLWT